MGKSHLGCQSLPEAYQQMFEEGINNGKILVPRK